MSERDTASDFITPISAALDDLNGPNADRAEHLTQQAAALYWLLPRRDFPSNEDGAWMRQAVKEATAKLDMYATELRVRALQYRPPQPEDAAKAAQHREDTVSALKRAAGLLWGWKKTKLAQIGVLKPDISQQAAGVGGRS